MTFPLEDLTLPYSGTVLRPFPFLFNLPIRETFEFLTDVITANDGTEQRIAVRNPARPRHGIGATLVCFERDEAQHLEALLFGWNRYTYGVPMWQDAMRLTVAAGEGDTELTVDETTGRDLVQRLTDEEDVPMLLWRAHDDWEPFLLAEAAGTTITARDPLAGDWTKGDTLVVPLQLMLLPESVEIQRPARAAATASLEFVSGQVPLSADPDCERRGEDTDAGVRVQMVRGTGAASMPYTSFVDYGHDMAGVARPVPICGDGAGPYNLFGLSRSASFGGTFFGGHANALVNGGLASGFSRCTRRAPAEFSRPVYAYGLGNVVGDDAALCVFGDLPDGTFVSEAGGPFVVASSFTGSGCIPGPGAPTLKHCVVVQATMIGGVGEGVAAASGDVVSTFGLYDGSVPGGIKYITIGVASEWGNRVAKFLQGYCLRLKGIGAYKGAKITVEDVVNPTDPPESWTYGVPEVTTHDFTTDDYTAARGTDACYVKALAFGSNMIGGAHDGDVGQAEGWPAQGYGHAFDNEWARVTVALYKADDVDRVQWVDHFLPMWVGMEMVV